MRPAGTLKTWGGAVRDALTAKKHRFELARSWRALLAGTLSDGLYHRVLRAFPTHVLPHVARPLQVPRPSLTPAPMLIRTQAHPNPASPLTHAQP